MTPADLRRVTEDLSEEDVEIGGLTGGLRAWHLRLLCENTFNGGGGYSPTEIGDWTLDQIWFRLCSLKTLEGELSGRSQKMPTTMVAASLPMEKDGTIKGRAADGTIIQGRIRGKSLARQLMEEEEAKKQKLLNCKKRGK